MNVILTEEMMETDSETEDSITTTPGKDPMEEIIEDLKHLNIETKAERATLTLDIEELIISLKGIVIDEPKTKNITVKDEPK